MQPSRRSRRDHHHALTDQVVPAVAQHHVGQSFVDGESLSSGTRGQVCDPQDVADLARTIGVLRQLRF